MEGQDPLKLKKFSPFKTFAFNSLGQKIKARPVIIFHDTENNYYYYIKARDARLDDGTLKERFKGEILIPKSGKDNTLFTKDSYLDCSQIFYMRDSELEELVKNHPDTEILDSKELEFDQVEEIFHKIYECLKFKPPFIVISKVSYDSKTETTKSEVQYASDEHLEKDYEKIKVKTNEIDELKDRLQKKKRQIILDLFEGVLYEAWNENWEEKVYNPLFEWIKENEFIQNGLNSMEIIHEYSKLSRPLVPTTINGKIIYASLINNKWHDGRDYSLSKKIIDSDYNFMLDWFEENDLDTSTESFNQFRESMQEEHGLTEVFYYYKLENQLKQEEKFKKDGPKMKM